MILKLSLIALLSVTILRSESLKDINDIVELVCSRQELKIILRKYPITEAEVFER